MYLVVRSVANLFFLLSTFSHEIDFEDANRLYSILKWCIWNQKAIISDEKDADHQKLFKETEFWRYRYASYFWSIKTTVPLTNYPRLQLCERNGHDM